MKYKILSLTILTLLLFGAACQQKPTIQNAENRNAKPNTNQTAQLPSGFVSVYLRATPINLTDDRFTARNTTSGLILKKAWYDAEQSFLIVGTTKTYWQYCSVTPEDWTAFTTTASFDSIVTRDFKIAHLCTKDNVPLYAADAVAAGFAAPTDGSQVIQLRKVFVDEPCDLKEYCEAENESGEAEDVYVYEAAGDHQLGIGEDDIAVEVYVR